MVQCQFFVTFDLEIWRMTLKNNRAPLLCYFKLRASFRSHWPVNSNWSDSPETPNLGQNRRFFSRVTSKFDGLALKNIRASPLLSNLKLYASFHYHMWLQTGVTVWKRLSWVVTSVTLTFDLWPWPFALTSLLSLVITPEIFVMIRWHDSEKGVTDRQTEERTDRKRCS